MCQNLEGKRHTCMPQNVAGKEGVWVKHDLCQYSILLAFTMDGMM